MIGSVHKNVWKDHEKLKVLNRKLGDDKTMIIKNIAVKPLVHFYKILAWNAVTSIR